MNVEIELKLQLPEGSMAKLSRHPLLRSSAARKARLSSIYFDTPALDLMASAVAVRLRKIGGKWIQTVKGGGGVLAGVHTRREWEHVVARGALDFTWLDDPLLVRLFCNSELRKSLFPVFSTEFSRKTAPVEFSGSLIECCLDTGKILAGAKEEVISELELELKSGKPSALFEFALELQKTVPLHVEGRSKAERGYALFTGTTGRRVTKAGIVGLESKMDAAEACRQIIHGCLLQIQGNVQGLLDRDPDSEYLHQMRVGARRMRSAFSLFSFAKPAFSEIAQELKWLGSELGPARNWDVFMEETLPPILAAFPDRAGLDELRKAGEAMREKLAKRAHAAIASQRFQKLLLEMGLALSREDWNQGETVGDFAKRTLEKRYRSFIKGGRGIASLDAAGLHALRISGKKLRYAAEFFSPLYPAHASRRFLAAMSELQDMLGAISDASTTSHLLDELPGSEASCLVRGWSAGGVRHRMGGMGKTWKKYKDIDPFWR